MESTEQKIIKIRLNAFSWHAITIGIMFIVNVIAYHRHYLTYDYASWYLLHYNWNYLIAVNVGLVLFHIILWDICSWGYWQPHGILLVVVYSVYYMWLFDSVIEEGNIVTLIVILLSSLLLFSSLGRPGGLSDKLIDWYVDTFESDKYPVIDDYNEKILSLKNYYIGDEPKFYVFREQVRILLEHELIDDDAIRMISAKENENKSEVTAFISLDNPEYNPLHPSFRNGKNEISEEMMDYIESGFRTDFIHDYMTARSKQKEYAYKPYDVQDIEKVMRNLIEGLDQVEVLLTYCMAALYKNNSDYRKFSIFAARTYTVLYVQNNIINFEEFFTDLVALLGAAGIENLDDVDYVDNEYEYIVEDEYLD